MKFGIEEIIHPFSTEKVASEKRLYILNDIKNKVAKISTSVKIDDETIPLAECIKAIKTLQEGGSEYTAVEFFTENKPGGKIVRMNVCHMQQVK